MNSTEWFPLGYGYIRYSVGDKTGLLFSPSGYLVGPSDTARSEHRFIDQVSMPKAFTDIRQGLLAMANTETNRTLAGVLRSLSDLYT